LKNSAPPPDRPATHYHFQGDFMKRAIIILVVAAIVAVELVPMFMDMQL
jgi:hypothetical protein